MSKRNKNNNKKKTKNTLERQQETFNDEGKDENPNEEQFKEQVQEQPQTENPPEIANQNLIEEQVIEVHQQKVENQDLEGGQVEDGQLQNQEVTTNQNTEQPEHKKEEQHGQEEVEVKEVKHEEVHQDKQENQEQQKLEQAPILNESEKIVVQQLDHAHHESNLVENPQQEKAVVENEIKIEKQDEVVDHQQNADIQHQIKEHINEIVDQIENLDTKEQLQNKDAALIQETLVQQTQRVEVEANLPHVEDKADNNPVLIQESKEEHQQVDVIKHQIENQHINEEQQQNKDAPLIQESLVQKSQELNVEANVPHVEVKADVQPVHIPQPKEEIEQVHVIKHETVVKEEVHIEEAENVASNQDHPKVEEPDKAIEIHNEKSPIQEQQQNAQVFEEENIEEVVQFKQKAELIELESTPTIQEAEVTSELKTSHKHDEEVTHIAPSVIPAAKTHQYDQQKVDEVTLNTVQEPQATQLTQSNQPEMITQINQQEKEIKPSLRTQQLEVSQVQSQIQEQQPNTENQAPKVQKSGLGNMISAAVVGALILGTIGGIVLNRVLRRI